VLSVAVPAGVADAIYVGGYGSSTNFPGIDGASADSFITGAEMFVVKFNVNLTTILGATYIGGEEVEGGGHLALDPSLGAGSPVYVAGFTESGEAFPGIGVGSADGTFVDGEATVSKIGSSLKRQFMISLELLKLFVQLLGLDLSHTRALILPLERAEHHGRHEQWPVADREIDRFIEAVQGLQARGGLDRETAARFIGLAEEASADLADAARADGPKHGLPWRLVRPPDQSPSCPAPPIPR
jgi:hypothetical protein